MSNPLKQYFRRPATYIRLPSGGKYNTKDDIEPTVDGEIPVYPMSAIDEITSRTPDALFNGHAVVDIIKSCIPNIKNPWKITTVDMDTILIGIRIASSGDIMDINCQCPHCNTEGVFGLNLTQLLTSRKDVNYSIPLKVRDLELKFKPLRYEETNANGLSQYEVQKIVAELEEITDDKEKSLKTKEALQYMNKITTDIISSTIDYIKTPETTVSDQNYIKEFINNCDRQTANAIKDHSVKLREETDLPPLHTKCTNCGEEFDQPLVLNITDFFV